MIYPVHHTHCSEIVVYCIWSESMCGTLKCIWCGCDPERFYNQIRVFMQGYKGNPTLPSGVTYGGTAVDESGMEKRHFYCGGSAA